MEPVHPGDLKELLLFAFAAALGKHPGEMAEDDKRKWKEFTPTPRSVFQRVDHALYAENAVPFDKTGPVDDHSPSLAAYEDWIARNEYKDTKQRRLAFEYGYRAARGARVRR
jgi:hypothetical protein